MSPSGEPEVKRCTTGASIFRLEGGELYPRTRRAPQKIFARPTRTAVSLTETVSRFNGTSSRLAETASRLTRTASDSAGTASRLVKIISDPAGTAPDPVKTGSDLVGTASRGTETHSRAIETASRRERETLRAAAMSSPLSIAAAPGRPGGGPERAVVDCLLTGDKNNIPRPAT